MDELSRIGLTAIRFKGSDVQTELSLPEGGALSLPRKHYITRFSLGNGKMA